MAKRAFLCAVAAIVIASGFPIAQGAEPGGTPLVARSDVAPTAGVTQALLRDIINWLAEHFDLPATDDLPGVAFTTPARMDALRYRGLLNRHDQSGAESNTVAVYDPTSATIYLREGWRGATPAEMSVLVHEVVHHLQHIANHPYACSNEREKLAYRAQERWLQRFDRSLASEFGTDGFTLLIRTSCGF